MAFRAAMQEMWGNITGENKEKLKQPNQEMYDVLNELLAKNNEVFKGKRGNIEYELERQKEAIWVNLRSNEADVPAEFLDFGGNIDSLLFNIDKDPKKSSIVGMNRLTKESDYAAPWLHRENFEEGMDHLRGIIIPTLQSIDSEPMGVDLA